MAATGWRPSAARVLAAAGPGSRSDPPPHRSRGRRRFSGCPSRTQIGMHRMLFLGGLHPAPRRPAASAALQAGSQYVLPTDDVWVPSFEPAGRPEVWGSSRLPLTPAFLVHGERAGAWVVAGQP